MIAFSIVDTGIGITREQQHLDLRGICPGGRHDGRQYGGTGLGLSISRELIRLLGGEIHFQSEPGVGSVFTVYLPIAAPALHVLPGGRTNGRFEGSPRTTAVTVGAGVGLQPGWHVEATQALARQQVQTQKTLLVVEDDPVQRQHLVELMASVEARTIAVGTGEEALALLDDQKFDCLVVDLGLPGVSGWEVIDHVRSHKALRSLPLLVYTAKELTKKEELKLGRATKTIVIKEVRSPERLTQEVKAVLEDPNAATASFQPGSNGGSESPELAGKKVLVVDDDIRNIFALTALLERHHMEVTAVDSGKEAIDALNQSGDFDVALVDVMMPEMDGYVTMTRMRELMTFGDRPIIALTAKAMKGDREKCIEAGASDYIAKPVNTPELLAMLRAWLTP